MTKIPHTGDKNLSTDVDSTTNTIFESSRDFSQKKKKKKQNKIIIISDTGCDQWDAGIWSWGPMRGLKKIHENGTYRQTDSVTTRKNRPKGQFFEKSFINIIKLGHKKYCKKQRAWSKLHSQLCALSSWIALIVQFLLRKTVQIDINDNLVFLPDMCMDSFLLSPSRHSLSKADSHQCSHKFQDSPVVKAVFSSGQRQPQPVFET